MIVAQNKLATTTFDKTRRLLESTYVGRVNIDLALEHLANVVEFYTKNEVQGSIANLSRLIGSYVKVIDYLVESYYPAATKSGLKVQAYVVSKDLINENLGNELDALAKKFGITSVVFTNKEEAEAWVNQQLKH